MRLTCPNCLTEYDVPDEAVAGRSRTLRCAYCGHQWRHDAPAGDGPVALEAVTPPVAPELTLAPAAPLIDVPPLVPEPLEPAAAPAPDSLFSPRDQALAARRAAAPRPVLPPTPPRRHRRAPLAIVLFVVLLVVVVVAAHGPIMHIWPASAGFYRALGMK